MTRAFVVAVLLAAGAASAALAQRRFLYGWDETVKNVPYDGRFTFARVRYRPAPGGNWAGGRPSWVHGYPLAERNLMRIMKDVCLLDVVNRRSVCTRRTTCGLDRCHGVACSVGIAAVVHRNRGPHRSQPFADAAADTATPARHQRYTSVEVTHSHILPSSDPPTPTGAASGAEGRVLE